VVIVHYTYSLEITRDAVLFEKNLYQKAIK
jgi:hypothetical protein